VKHNVAVTCSRRNLISQAIGPMQGTLRDFLKFGDLRRLETQWHLLWLGETDFFVRTGLETRLTGGGYKPPLRGDQPRINRVANLTIASG
jgi:hypothetical protein